MAKTTAYSMLNVTVTIDHRQVQGLWDGDDAVVVTENSDVSTMLIGADGSSLISISADHAAQISIKLQHTSPMHRFLHQKLKQTRARGANATGFSFTVKDKVSGEGGTCDQCFIMAAPGDSKGMKATVREWKLITGDWSPEIPNG